MVVTCQCHCIAFLGHCLIVLLSLMITHHVNVCMQGALSASSPSTLVLQPPGEEVRVVCSQVRVPSSIQYAQPLTLTQPLTMLSGQALAAAYTRTSCSLQGCNQAKDYLGRISGTDAHHVLSMLTQFNPVSFVGHSACMFHQLHARTTDGVHNHMVPLFLIRRS